MSSPNQPKSWVLRTNLKVEFSEPTKKLSSPNQHFYYKKVEILIILNIYPIMAFPPQTSEQQVQYAKNSWYVSLILKDLNKNNPRTLSTEILDFSLGQTIKWIMEDKISCPEVRAFFQEEYDKLSEAVKTKKFSHKTIDDCLEQIFLKGVFMNHSSSSSSFSSFSSRKTSDLSCRTRGKFIFI